MKTLKRIIISVGISCILVFILLITVQALNHFGTKVNSGFDECEEFVGSSVVVNKDTLLIMEYTVWRGFELENGMVVSYKFIEERLSK